MFISKKRWQALVNRVADLEGQVQSQQTVLAPNVLNGKVHVSTEDFVQSRPSYKA